MRDQPYPSEFDKREGQTVRKDPEYRVIPLNGAHFARELSGNAQKS
jgi:hypothetical protein